MSKIKNIEKHGVKRLGERFELNKEDYRILISMIQNNDGTFIERQSNRKTVWLLKYKSKKIKAVYDKNRKRIITVLYPRNKDKKKIGEQNVQTT